MRWMIRRGNRQILGCIFHIMVYIAEFSLVGTMELADEILICAESEQDAQLFARHYASNWGIDLHSLRVATDRYIRVAEHCPGYGIEPGVFVGSAGFVRAPNKYS